MNVPARAAALALAALLALPRAGEGQTPAICSDTPPDGYSVYCGWNDANIDIDLRNQTVSTTGYNEVAVQAYKLGAGTISMVMVGTTLETTGGLSSGIYGYLGNAASTQPLAIDVTGGSIATAGARARGILGWHAGAGLIDVDFAGGTIATAGAGATGIFGYHTGAGRLVIDMTSGSIAAAGAGAHGILGFTAAAANEAALAIDVTGGTVTAEDISGYGAYGAHNGLGSVAITTGAGAEIKAPFSIGLFGRLARDESAAGRIFVRHGGAVEARDVGVQAWARRSSGHTSGDGAQTADDDARTAPLIAVSSSGTIAVGASVTDAFIQGRIAGADETLSTGEKAVLDAISAEDSDALDTALAALDDDDYDAAWKAEARNLLAKLTAEPTSAGAAYAAAGEILRFSRAGIRALALSHTGIADYIRQGDRDPAILAIEAAMRTPQQQAALAEQEKLSAAERTVLEAVLTGGDLTAALAALPAAYTDVWKGGVRRRAASYNAGDIRVDITGGSISAEGNGVEALYALPHDSNGAIAVTVAEDARVTGGANGIYVRGAGAGEGSVHAQSVTVNGAAMGGTGAGVHMAGGGTLTVGADGAVGAASGVGVLADGGGGMTATVSGTVTGDIRIDGGGALTVNVTDGGSVTGTMIRSDAGAVTLRGRIGRILFNQGGTATVAADGAVTGLEIDGETETIRAAAGDLSVTVAGRIEGDLRPADNGGLTANIVSGGVVTGTLRDPRTPLTVAGSVGRILYDNGGTMTVAGGGAVTGVEIGGSTEAIRSDAGNLDVTVAAAGAVTGSIEDRGAGNLKAAVSGTVTGGIAERGAGDLDVTVSGMVTGGVVGEGAGAHKVTVESSGAVAGTVRLPASAEMTIAGKVGRVRYDNGGAVTVAASGAITGLEIEGVREAIRSAAGDLTVTVHGAVTGNIEARGDGNLTVKVSETGAVTGEIFGRGGGTHTVEIAEKARVLGTVHNPKSGTTVHGAAGRVLFDNGGALTIAATGSIAGIDGEAIRADAGDLEVMIASGGMATGRVEGRGAGNMTVNVSGAVRGAIHGKGVGKHEVTVASGGMATGDIVDFDAGDLVASIAGRVTGSIEERGAGDLTATVTGTVTGGIRGMGAGSHTVAVQDGGAVAGAVRLSSGATTIAGRVGRVLYDNGGSVTVAGGGAIAGVETDGATEAIRSAAGDLTVAVAARATVTGDIRGEGDGDLDVDVSGTVKGGIFGLGGGEHDVHVQSGGAVEGLIHLAASAVTVDGSAGSVRFDRGGTVAVGAEGRISGLDGRAVHSAAGDLTITVNGDVTGNIEGLGAGALTVTVANALTGDVIGGGGGVHRLTVQSGAMFKGNVGGVEFIRIAGRAEGTLEVPAGGEVAVPVGGALVGAEDAQGRRVAIIAETGALSLTVDGDVEGAVEAADADAASTVTVGADGTVDGKVLLAGAGSEVTVDGAAQSVEAPRGMVTIGENGRIEDGVSGAVAVTVKAAADESDAAVAARVGRIEGAAAVTLKRAGEDDAVLTTDDEGRLVFAAPGPRPASPRAAPRHRVYEALPSVLLALNALPDFGGALASASAGRAAAARYELAANGDMAVARTADARRGAWARFHAGGGDRRPASSAAGGAHDIRRYAFEAGMEGAVGGNALVSVSVHHVRGEADVEEAEGEGAESGGAEVSGTGARMAGAWFPAGDYYVGGQAAATLYEADLDSTPDGALASGISGRGYTIGAEAGRRFDLGRAALTPRARVSWSRIDMSPFTDPAGDRVSLDGRSIKARAGVRVDTATPAGGVFATADVERELSGSIRAKAADMVLEAEAEATWLHLGLGGAHEWADGRFALRATANYAAAPNGNRDFAGNASLTVRF